jgi:hypothetical protein
VSWATTLLSFDILDAQLSKSMIFLILKPLLRIWLVKWQYHLTKNHCERRFFQWCYEFEHFSKLLQSFVSRGLICEISTLKAYIFQTVWRKNPKISLKNQEFIRDSVKKIKKYGYRVKNRSYFPYAGFLDVNDEKCLFLIQEKTTITNFLAKINQTGVKRIRWRKY